MCVEWKIQNCNMLIRACVALVINSTMMMGDKVKLLHRVTMQLWIWDILNFSKFVTHRAWRRKERTGEGRGEDDHHYFASKIVILHAIISNQLERFILIRKTTSVRWKLYMRVSVMRSTAKWDQKEEKVSIGMEMSQQFLTEVETRMR